jgi:flagellar biosynthesis protein FliP
MNTSDLEDRSDVVHTRIQWAVLCTLVGLSCVLLFLLSGFQSWSVGIGVFFGLLCGRGGARPSPPQRALIFPLPILRVV